MVCEAEYQEMAENVDMRETHHGGNHCGASTVHDCHPGQSHGEKTSSPSPWKPQYPHRNAPNASIGSTKSNGSGKKHTPPDTHHHNGQSSRASEPSRTLSKEGREDLKVAGKCFICRKDGHFSQNCPDKSRGVYSGNKPPGISAGSVRFGDEVNLKCTEQLHMDCLGETTKSLSVWMVGFSLPNCYLDNRVYQWLLQCLDKEYDSEGDTIPDLQSVSDSGSKEDKQSVHNYLMNKPPMEAEAFEELEPEVLLALPQNFERTYPFIIENGEEKLCIVEAGEEPRTRLGHAAAQKAEDLLESMQPYPGDPTNVLQYRGRHFQAYSCLSREILIHDLVFDSLGSIKRQRVTRVTYKLGEWYAGVRHSRTGTPFEGQSIFGTCYVVDVVSWNAHKVLESGIPFPGESEQKVGRYDHFDVLKRDDMFKIVDNHLDWSTMIEPHHLENAQFDLISWYQKRLSEVRSNDNTCAMPDPLRAPSKWINMVDLHGQQIPMGTYPAIQQNSRQVQDPSRMVPKPLVIVVKINNEPA
ncbi:hypothetical protein C0993_006782 [Termitomyces sp. T159_Od127]|nr:hypothetical protein C0993_006782 [Termitomyces sp. T159_Od127]